MISQILTLQRISKHAIHSEEELEYKDIGELKAIASEIESGLFSSQ